MLTLRHVLGHAYDAGIRSVAIIGLSKNVGKTTTINALASSLESRLTLGLTSAGRDGEPIDMLTNLPKPRIGVRPGDLVATATRALEVSTARMRTLAATGALTAMGPVAVAVCEGAGRVELVGPATAWELHGVIGALRDHGASMVLVDGALDRRASAAPAVTSALVMATGAALSPDMELVIQRTRLAAELYRLPSVAQVLSGAVEPVPVESGAGISLMQSDGRWVPLTGFETGLGQYQEIAAAARGSQATAIQGALTTQLLISLSEAGIRLLVVRDATRVFVDWSTFNHFRSLGGQLAVVHPSRLLAVSINPWSPIGRGFPPEMLLDRVARAVAPTPVFDVVRGVSRGGKEA